MPPKLKVLLWLQNVIIYLFRKIEELLVMLVKERAALRDLCRNIKSGVTAEYYDHDCIHFNSISVGLWLSFNSLALTLLHYHCSPDQRWKCWFNQTLPSLTWFIPLLPCLFDSNIRLNHDLNAWWKIVWYYFLGC